MPATYHVNCAFAWVTVLLAIIGYSPVVIAVESLILKVRQELN
jgi:hypothetical protein